MPPQKRKWRGSTVAPFAGNNMLVLYSCSAPDKSTSKHFVQVLHNEHPIPLPVSSCYLSFTNDYGPRVAIFQLLSKIILRYHLSITRYVSSCTGLWWLWSLPIWTIQGTFVVPLLNMNMINMLYWLRHAVLYSAILNFEFSPQEKIVAPHQKHDYHTVCNPKLEHEPSGSKFFQIFQWLFSSAKGDNYSKDEF